MIAPRGGWGGPCRRRADNWTLASAAGRRWARTPGELQTRRFHERVPLRLEQAKRRRRRALLPRINARLEKVAEHGVVVDEPFIANLVLPENEATRRRSGRWQKR